MSTMSLRSLTDLRPPGPAGGLLKIALVASSLALLLWMVVFSAVAHADGDPASDFLPVYDVFYPYLPVSPALQKALNAEVASAHSARFPIKVALISSPQDLGAIPELFGRPRLYARFLDLELNRSGGRAEPPLLVVMASGFGVQGLTSPAAHAATSLPRPRGQEPDDLARAAVEAVTKLAAAEGHAIKGVPIQSASSADSDGVLALRILSGLVAVGCAAILIRRGSNANTVR